jgi:hypothetical protein
MERTNNAGTLIRLMRLIERECRFQGADIEQETQKIIEKVMTNESHRNKDRP